MFKNLKILRPVLAVLILFIPLYPKFPLANVKGTYVAIRLDDMVVAIAILIWIIYQIKNNFPVFKQNITKLFLAYFIAITLSTVNAILIYQTDPANILILHLLRRFEYMSLFFITIDAVKSRLDLKFPYIALIITTLGVNIFGYGQKYLNFPVISTMNAEFSKGTLLQMNVWTRISSTFAGHYDLAAYLSLVLLITLAVTTLIKNKPIKFLSLLFWLISFQIFTFTASRVSTFAFWGGMTLTLLLLKKFLWIVPFSLIMIVTIFFSADLNQRLLATLPAIKQIIPDLSFKKPESSKPTPTPTLAPIAIVDTTPEPIKPEAPKPTSTPLPTIVRNRPEDENQQVDTDAGVARSGEIRFNAEWPRAITAFRKNPLIGNGLGSITLATDNDYLRLLGESGILGFLTFLAIPLYFVFQTFPVIFKKKRTLENNLAIVLFGSVLVMLANATLIDVFESSKPAYLFWIMMGVYYRVLTISKNKS